MGNVGRGATDASYRFGELIRRLDGSADDNEPTLERARQLLRQARQRILDLEAAHAALEVRVAALEARP